jgi:hypothetical protein
MRLDRFGRGPLRWRRSRPGPHYEYAGGYGAAQAARRARFRRGLWWSTLVAAVMVALCCAGVVVSQIGLGGTVRPARPTHTPTTPTGHATHR